MKIKCLMCNEYIKCKHHDVPLNYSFWDWLKVKLGLVKPYCEFHRKVVLEWAKIGLREVKRISHSLDFEVLNSGKKVEPMMGPDEALKMAITTILEQGVKLGYDETK